MPREVQARGRQSQRESSWLPSQMVTQCLRGGVEPRTQLLKSAKPTLITMAKFQHMTYLLCLRHSEQRAANRICRLNLAAGTVDCAPAAVSSQTWWQRSGSFRAVMPSRLNPDQLVRPPRLRLRPLRTIIALTWLRGYRPSTTSAAPNTAQERRRGNRCVRLTLALFSMRLTDSSLRQRKHAPCRVACARRATIVDRMAMRPASTAVVRPAIRVSPWLDADRLNALG